MYLSAGAWYRYDWHQNTRFYNILKSDNFCNRILDCQVWIWQSWFALVSWIQKLRLPIWMASGFILFLTLLHSINFLQRWNPPELMWDDEIYFLSVGLVGWIIAAVLNLHRLASASDHQNPVSHPFLATNILSNMIWLMSLCLNALELKRLLKDDPYQICIMQRHICRLATCFQFQPIYLLAFSSL